MSKKLKWWLIFIFGSAGIIPIIIPLFFPKEIVKTTFSHNSNKQSVVGNTINNKNGTIIINSGNSSQTQYKATHSKRVNSAPIKEVIGRSAFFNQNYGTLALLPNAKDRSTAINTNHFYILSPGKQHCFKRLNPFVWIQFNHYLPETNSKQRHLGIFVVTFGRMGATMPLEVYRNKNWVRPQSNKILGQFSEIVDMPWSDFTTSIKKWSTSEADLSEVDRAVKGPWHAIPQGGDKFSWQYRNFWKWAVLSCQDTAKDVLGEGVSFDNVKVSARLVRYSPSPRPASNYPVVFDIRSMYEENTCVFIAIYALDDNNQDIRNWYWIKRLD